MDQKGAIKGVDIVPSKEDMLTEDYKVESKNGGFTAFLDELGATYKIYTPYLKIGDTVIKQGWIIHISIIRPQISTVLHNIIPFLIKEGVCFKIPLNLDLAQRILDSGFGVEMIGKIIKIYPETEEHLVSLASKMVQLTKGVRGPKVNTDSYLGGSVYVRYGAFKWENNTDESGNYQKMIYDTVGKRMYDNKFIPFELPFKMDWPFKDITPVKKNEGHGNFLGGKYLIKNLLKSDAKGSVFTGYRIFPLYDIKFCIIKQGRSEMWVNEFGQGIQERLKTQFDFHSTLSKKISVPKVYDLFEEKGDTFMSMEYIEGTSFQNFITDRYQNGSWDSIGSDKRIEIIDFLMGIVKSVGELHFLGYVHRDLSPENALLSAQGQVSLIDTELMFNIHARYPWPAYYMGTIGFTAPEQIGKKEPTIKEDIYSLGCLLIYGLTGLDTRHFDLKNLELLNIQLAKRIHNISISEFITTLVSENSDLRPNCDFILKHLMNFRDSITECIDTDILGRDFSEENILTVIKRGINAYYTNIFLNGDGLWYSPQRVTGSNYVVNYLMVSTVYPGVNDGMSGVLILLMECKKRGFITEELNRAIRYNFNFIINNFLYELNSNWGYFNGMAGFALLKDVDKYFQCDYTIDLSNFYEKYFQKLQNEHSLDLANGMAGVGISIIRSSKFSPGNKSIINLRLITDNILQAQQPDGSWILNGRDSGSNNRKYTGMFYGVSGILYYLLEYMDFTQDYSISEKVHRGIDWICNTRRRTKLRGQWPIYDKSEITSESIMDGGLGIVLMLLSAFKFTKDNKYRSLVENILRSYSPTYINNDFSTASGLVGLGEVYIEAFKVFDSVEWMTRAKEITFQVLNSVHFNGPNSLYWENNKTGIKVPGLLNGQAGILYFLLRFNDPKSLRFPLL